MKNLKDYVHEYLKRYDEKVEYDELDNIVLDHCYIHYRFNYRKSIEHTIYESDGAFPGEHELVANICSEIHKNNKKNDAFTFIVGNDIVEKIYVHLDKNNINDINGGYISKDEGQNYNELRWDAKDNRFRIAEIRVFNYQLNPEGLEEMMYHELKHMWQDYIEITKKGTFLYDKINKSLWQKFEKSNISEIIKKILYYAEDFEIDAYIAQINGIFKNRQFIDIKSALDEVIKKSPTYNNYKEMYIVMHSDTAISILRNHLSNKEISKIRKNIDKGWKKIINHTYLICGKHVNNDGVEIYVNRYENFKEQLEELVNKELDHVVR